MSRILIKYYCNYQRIGSDEIEEENAPVVGQEINWCRARYRVKRSGDDWDMWTGRYLVVELEKLETT